ncbi:MAG: M3 family metallopeptidase, partial [Bacteroidales bacterium]
CNFTKPTETAPSLLTFREVTTLFHEFGHALHGMLAEGKYKSLSGTNVTIDFVELPSQIMENWAIEEAFLDSFAKHYQTGEVISKELINKIIAVIIKVNVYVFFNLSISAFGDCNIIFHPVTSEVLKL